MSNFDARDIRRTMDVYSIDNVYLGSVLRVLPRPLAASPADDAKAEQPPEPHDPDHPFNGERLGPASTAALGNAGPATQMSSRAYGSAPDSAPALGQGVLHVGKWWGLGGTYTIPLDAVQAVSMERVVLRVRANELRRGRA
jgi:hypothetical protein